MPDIFFPSDLNDKIVKVTGRIYYVSANGGDSRTGLKPEKSLATIGEAISRVAPGDLIVVGPNTYAEVGIDLNVASVQIFFCSGVILSPSSGTCLVVSANNCELTGECNGLQITAAAGATGVQITGSSCFVECVRVNGTGIGCGFDINGFGCELHYCRANGVEAAGKAFDVVGGTRLYDCSTVGGSTTTGFYLDGARGLMVNCTSVGHVTRGFHFAPTSSYWTSINCTSGGGDGTPLDEGDQNKSEIDDQLPEEQHEHVYPYCVGEGVAATAVDVTTDSQDETNGAQSDQYYWGEPYTIIPQYVLTNRWYWVGLNIHGNTTGKTFQWEGLCTSACSVQDKNGGNAWDEGETDLTVADASKFAAGDLVWIYSTYKPSGEIVRIGSINGNVVTIERETNIHAATGLRWDHTTNAAGTETMSLVRRPSTPQYHGFQGDFSCGSSKDFSSYRWHLAKRMQPNSGLIIRVLNRTNSLNGAGFGVTAIYED